MYKLNIPQGHGRQTEFSRDPFRGKLGLGSIWHGSADA